MTTPDYTRVWTVADWCAVLGRHPNTILKMLKAGSIPGRQFKAGGPWYTQPGDARAWMDGRYREPAAPVDFLRKREVA